MNGTGKVSFARKTRRHATEPAPRTRGRWGWKYAGRGSGCTLEGVRHGAARPGPVRRVRRAGCVGASCVGACPGSTRLIRWRVLLRVRSDHAAPAPSVFRSSTGRDACNLETRRACFPDPFLFCFPVLFFFVFSAK